MLFILYGHIIWCYDKASYKERCGCVCECVLWVCIYLYVYAHAFVWFLFGFHSCQFNIGSVNVLLLKQNPLTGFHKEINRLHAEAGIFQRTGPIPWLLMPWPLVSPGYQQSRDWLRMINRSLSSMVKGLTHWGRGEVATILQTTFSNAFSWMKMYKFHLTFHWGLLQLTTIQHWFRKWLGTGQATSHYLN